MNNQIVVYIYSKVLFSHKKERSTDICYDLDKLQKYFAKKWSHTQRPHIVWFHLYEVFIIDKSTETEGGLVVAMA